MLSLTLAHTSSLELQERAKLFREGCSLSSLSLSPRAALEIRRVSGAECNHGIPGLYPSGRCASKCAFHRSGFLTVSRAARLPRSLRGAESSSRYLLQHIVTALPGREFSRGRVSYERESAFSHLRLSRVGECIGRDHHLRRCFVVVRFRVGWGRCRGFVLRGCFLMCGFEGEQRMSAVYGMLNVEIIYCTIN